MAHQHRLPSPIDDGVTAEDLGSMLFIGVGGVGLSGLARLYATRGLPVSGSELHDWPSLVELERLGVTIFRQHRPANLDGIDTVVRSTAHPDDHIELVEARRRGLRIMHRSEALAAAMTGRVSVAVAGTHGKTTTSAMMIEMLQMAGLDPSFVNGGESAADGRSGGHGEGRHFVIEADESDRSFLRYRPDVAIVTNIDADHLNNYGSLDGLKDGFTSFGDNVVDGGVVVVCADDAAADEVGDRLAAKGRTVLRYGTAEHADLHIDELKSDVDGAGYRARYQGRDLGRFRIPVPGAHLALNSAAVLLTGLWLGVEAADIRKGLAAFSGVRRRFELVGTAGGVRVYDEYAYHPTAITAALSTLKKVAGSGRLVLVFQPYRVYRTRDLRVEIARALSIADRVVVMEVFGPGEDVSSGDGGRALCEAIPLPDEHKLFVPEWDRVPVVVAGLAERGDIVVTMGAPPLSLMPAELLSALDS